MNRVSSLMAAREQKTVAILAEMRKWRADEIHANHHKEGQLRKLRVQLAEVEREYRERIDEAVQKARNAARRLYHFEPEGDLAGELRQLRRVVETRDLTDDLVRRYSTEGPERRALWEQAEDAVSANLPTAPAYLRALEQIEPGGDRTQELRQQWELASRTPEQKRALRKLERIGELVAEYEQQSLKDRTEAGLAGLGDAVAAHYAQQRP